MKTILRALVIDASDNVATAMAELESGSEVRIETGSDQRIIRVVDTIPTGHKLALSSIKCNEVVRKYAAPIGLATQDIAAGTHVHSHNLTSQRGRGDMVSGDLK